jgi:hypothetical protein
VNGLPSYDVERLGTGDESAGGPSAERLDLASRSPDSGSSGGLPARPVVPARVHNTVAFVAPVWMSAPVRAAAVLGLAAALALALLALVGRIRRYREDVSRPGN